MHFALTYDLSAQGARRNEIESRIEEILNPYVHVKRLTTFYIIHVNDNIAWEQIRQALTNLSQGIQEVFYFIMTPPIRGGRYNGILSNGEWDEINRITNMN